MTALLVRHAMTAGMTDMMIVGMADMMIVGIIAETTETDEIGTTAGVIDYYGAAFAAPVLFSFAYHYTFYFCIISFILHILFLKG